MKFFELEKDFKEGRGIRRKAWPPGNFLSLTGGGFFIKASDFFCDDWELVSEPVQRGLSFPEAVEKCLNNRNLCFRYETWVLRNGSIRISDCNILIWTSNGAEVGGSISPRQYCDNGWMVGTKEQLDGECCK